MTKFTDLKLDPKVLKAIAEAGYEQPTPIQAGAIPPALEGRDVLGIAQTGTGKTASFTLPMITLLGRGRARARMPRSLVLCPTRELAAQVAENFDVYAKHTKLTKALLIGGVSFGEQDKLIDRGVDVLIATPGRLLDHFERGKLILTDVKVMVVDEADRMLDMGFIPDIERIFQLTPFTRQTLFFSATMAPEIERITNTFLHAPERIEIARQATTSETITQRLVELAPPRRDLVAKQKRDLLRALVDAEGEKLTNAIIFCNRKTDVDIVAKSLKKHGYDAAPIHGDLDQSQRTRTLESFRDGGLRLLVASDVAARGLDIPAVSHVFNYDLPSHAEDYVHRIGRTGRAGRLGTAYSIATPSDEKYLTAIESLVKMTLPRADIPEGFQASTAPSRAPKSDDREERKSGGTRTRSRRRKDDQSEGRQSESRQSEARQPETKQAEEQPRQSNERREERRDDRRGSNRRDGGRDGGRDRGAPVKGMGDHVPQFMLVDLWPKAGITPDDDPEAETVEAAPAPEAEAPKPKRSRSRSRRKSDDKAADTPAEAPADAPVEAEAPVEQAAAEAVEAPAPEAAAPEAAAPEAPAEEAVTTEEAPKPKRRSRAKKAETAEAAPEAEATEEAPKPKRRSRAKKAETAEAAPEAETTEEAPKPKRRSRAKKAETAEVAPEAEATEEAPKPKRRSRAKKAEPESPAPESPAPESTAQDSTEA